MDRERVAGIAATYAEALAALGGAVALTLALTLVLTAAVVLIAPPDGLRAEVPLRAAEGAEDTRVSHEELVRRLEDSGVAAAVDIVGLDGAERLVLSGVLAAETAEAQILSTLSGSGYQLDSLEFTREVDPVELIKRPSILIPGMAIQTIVFLAVGALMIRWRVVPSPSMVGQLGAVGWGVAGGLFAVGLGTGMAALLELIGLPVREQPLLEELMRDRQNLIRLAPWIILAAPVAEEVFFRGYLFRFISQGAGFPAGFLTSSVLFAAVHLNMSGFLVYLAVGCAFAVVYTRTSRLLAPITAHVVYNGVLVALMAFAPPA